METCANILRLSAIDYFRRKLYLRCLTGSSIRLWPAQIIPSQVLGLAFPDGGPYHTETSTLVCTVNQWTGFYMIGTSVMKESKILHRSIQRASFSAQIQDVFSNPVHYQIAKMAWLIQQRMCLIFSWFNDFTLWEHPG